MKNTILILLLFGYVANAQPKYFKKEIFFSDVHSAHKVLSIDDDYVIAGNYTATDTIKWQSYINAFDKYGNDVFLKKYDFIESAISTNNLVRTNTGYAFAGWIYENSLSNTDCFLMQVGEYGSYINLTPVIFEGYSSSLRSLIQTPNNHFLATGNVVGDTEAYAHIIKFDEQGDTLWTRIYQNYGASILFNIIESPDQSGYYACGNANMDFSGNPDQSDILLAKIDENGNVLWDTIYNPSGNDQAVEMAITADNHLLIAGLRTVNPGTQTRLGLLYKMDLSGNIIWENNLYAGFYSAVRVLSDGNYGTCGSIYRSNGISNYQLDALLVKIDAETGQTMWHRSFGSISHQDYAYDFTPTPDGGFMVVGRMDSTNYAYAYALKLNCMGLLTEPQAAFAYELVNQSQYVYPDSIDGGHYVWDFGDGSPPFRCGQGYGACPDVVTHEYAAAQGQHTITLRAVVCSDTSAVTASVALGSGIGGQSVGVEAVEEEAANPTPTLLHFVPNPATNTLQMDYRLATGETATLKLYDMLGRELQQHLLAGQGTLQADVQILPNGVYLYTLQSSKGTNLQGKFVIVK